MHTHSHGSCCSANPPNCDGWADKQQGGVNLFHLDTYPSASSAVAGASVCVDNLAVQWANNLYVADLSAPSKYALLLSADVAYVTYGNTASIIVSDR